MARDFRQSPADHVTRRFDTCATDYVLHPDEVEQWKQDHRHEETK